MEMIILKPFLTSSYVTFRKCLCIRDFHPTEDKKVIFIINEISINVPSSSASHWRYLKYMLSLHSRGERWFFIWDFHFFHLEERSYAAHTRLALPLEARNGRRWKSARSGWQCQRASYLRQTQTDGSVGDYSSGKSGRQVIKVKECWSVCLSSEDF